MYGLTKLAGEYNYTSDEGYQAGSEFRQLSDTLFREQSEAAHKGALKGALAGAIPGALAGFGAHRYFKGKPLPSSNKYVQNFAKNLASEPAWSTVKGATGAGAIGAILGNTLSGNKFYKERAEDYERADALQTIADQHSDRLERF